LQNAYQFVKDKRPAISPNLNFMGQLVQFEKELLNNPNNTHKLDISGYLPTSAQMELSEAIRQSSGGSGSSSANNTPEPKSAGATIGSASVEASGQPFLLKMPMPRRHKKQQKSGVSMQPNDNTNQQSDAADPSACFKPQSSNSPFIPQPAEQPASTTAPFPNQLSSAPSSIDKPPAFPSIPPSSTSSVVKDIVKKFEKFD
jgi:dual specificity MAP kinase phosphatase